jgi:hypothetical protein
MPLNNRVTGRLLRSIRLLEMSGSGVIAVIPPFLGEGSGLSDRSNLLE